MKCEQAVMSACHPTYHNITAKSPTSRPNFLATGAQAATQPVHTASWYPIFPGDHSKCPKPSMPGVRLAGPKVGAQGVFIAPLRHERAFLAF